MGPDTSNQTRAHAIDTKHGRLSSLGSHGQNMSQETGSVLEEERAEDIFINHSATSSWCHLVFRNLDPACDLAK